MRMPLSVSIIWSKLLESKEFPNVDTFNSYEVDKIASYVHLSPVGKDVMPGSGTEGLTLLLECYRC